jgi:hypothetical protein
MQLVCRIGLCIEKCKLWWCILLMVMNQRLIMSETMIGFEFSL